MFGLGSRAPELRESNLGEFLPVIFSPPGVGVFQNKRKYRTERAREGRG